jgi:hypothetical protein
MKGEGRTKRKADKLLFIERFCCVFYQKGEPKARVTFGSPFTFYYKV